MIEVKNKKLLFITNAEFGQSSVHISTIRELLSGQDSVEIHLLSFPSLRARVTDLLKASDQDFEFHSLLSAPSFVQKQEEGWTQTEALSHSTGFFASLGSYMNLGTVVLPWNGEEYLNLYDECCRFIKEIQPDLCIVDALFFPGLDACEGLKQNHSILSPVAWRGDQGLKKMFSYPTMSSGYAYPVVPHLKPLNYLLKIFMIFSLIFGAVWREIEAARKQVGLIHKFPSFLVPKKVLTISAAAPECDFPFEPNPELSLPVGPMVQPIQDLQEVDPELYSFISRKPTILLALGSHVATTEKMSIGLSLGFKKVLEKKPDVQILWKVRTSSGSSKDDGTNFDPLENIRKVLGVELAQDRIRIVDWLKADPVSILATGHIICSINHGGANSYLEAVHTGVPQVILACWYDTMENAAKAEYLGIGTFGNRRAAPNAEAEEFSSSLLKVIGNEKMKQRAVEVAEQCRKRGGARAASDKILELAA